MNTMTRDHQGLLVYMEKGGSINPSSKLDKNKEVNLQEKRNLLLKQTSHMVAIKGETFHAFWERFMTLLDAHPNHGYNT